MKSRDQSGKEVSIGDTIKVLAIDKRITEYLPEDEQKDLASFVGDIFVVKNINSDGSMLVRKSWNNPEIGEIIGHEVAIFPEGALLVRNS